MAQNIPTKICAVCGRTITWRKKWARDWEQVRYCSARCRSRGRSDVDCRLEAEIVAQLDRRARGATICPSEVARACFDEATWRDQMERVREAARRLVARGEIEITQRGRVVDPSRARGPIRLRRVR